MPVHCLRLLPLLYLLHQLNVIQIQFCMSCPYRFQQKHSRTVMLHSIQLPNHYINGRLATPLALRSILLLHLVLLILTLSLPHHLNSLVYRFFSLFCQLNFLANIYVCPWAVSFLTCLNPFHLNLHLHLILPLPLTLPCNCTSINSLHCGRILCANFVPFPSALPFTFARSAISFSTPASISYKFAFYCTHSSASP